MTSPITSRPISPVQTTDTQSTSDGASGASSQRTVNQEPTGGLARRQSSGGTAQRSPLSQALQNFAAAKPVGVLIPGLPDELASNIIQKAIPRSASGRGKLMEVNRAWLNEINRLSTHDPVVREAVIEDRQGWSARQIGNLVDDRTLSREQVRDGVAQVLGMTDDVGIDVGEPPFSGGRENKLQNRLVALQELSQRTNMKTLKLVATEFAAASPDVLVSAIGSFLANNAGLEDAKIFLNKSGITATDAAALVTNMAGKPVSRLWLDGCTLGSEGTVVISQHLPSMGLKDLGLSGCSVGDSALPTLFGALPKGLRELDLSDNEITNAGVAGIVAALPSTTLESVDLGENDIDEEFVALMRTEQPRNVLGKPVQLVT